VEQVRVEWLELAQVRVERRAPAPAEWGAQVPVPQARPEWLAQAQAERLAQAQAERLAQAESLEPVQAEWPGAVPEEPVAQSTSAWSTTAAVTRS
jgi:hypothetical protein